MPCRMALRCKDTDRLWTLFDTPFASIGPFPATSLRATRPRRTTSHAGISIISGVLDRFSHWDTISFVRVQANLLGPLASDVFCLFDRMHQTSDWVGSLIYILIPGWMDSRILLRLDASRHGWDIWWIYFHFVVWRSRDRKITTLYRSTHSSIDYWLATNGGRQRHDGKSASVMLRWPSYRILARRAWQEEDATRAPSSVCGGLWGVICGHNLATWQTSIESMRLESRCGYRVIPYTSDWI